MDTIGVSGSALRYIFYFVWIVVRLLPTEDEQSAALGLLFIAVAVYMVVSGHQERFKRIAERYDHPAVPPEPKTVAPSANPAQPRNGDAKTSKRAPFPAPLSNLTTTRTAGSASV